MMNTEFYYQIKGKKAPDQTSISNWVFPPIFSGKVSAKNKKEAKEIICEDYGRQFPSRVLNSDIESNEYLLSIEEIKPNTQLQKLFEPQECEQCRTIFYVIDKYNDVNCHNKGFSFCSDYCKNENNRETDLRRSETDAISRNVVPMIYKITNKNTKKVYIGKTTQVITLRWYQHFFHTGSNKFHDEIRKSKMSDWTFEVEEIVAFPDHLLELDRNVTEWTERNKFREDREKFIIERERFWINHYNSIENGYNSI